MYSIGLLEFCDFKISSFFVGIGMEQHHLDQHQLEQHRFEQNQLKQL